jgi:hypothetical protein
MSYMSEIELARQEGDKVVMVRTFRGKLVAVCTSCLRNARKARLVRHEKGCPHRGAPAGAAEI